MSVCGEFIFSTLKMLAEDAQPERLRRTTKIPLVPSFRYLDIDTLDRGKASP